MYEVYTRFGSPCCQLVFLAASYAELLPLLIALAQDQREATVYKITQAGRTLSPDEAEECFDSAVALAQRGEGTADEQ